MSPGILGLLAVVSVLVLVTVVTVLWSHRTPSVRRDEDEVLPLFSGSGRATPIEIEENVEPVEATSSANARNGSPQHTPLESAPAPRPPTRNAPPTTARAAAFGTSPYGPPPSFRASANGTAAFGPPSFASPANGVGNYAAPPASEQTNPSIRTFTTGAPTPQVVATATEAQLVQFTVPTEGTLQFLPGRLEITSGTDAGREIRFVRLPGPNGTEFTFGRSGGEPYRHIQLRDQTVSRSHARMRFHDGHWYLRSLSLTNPVVLDEAALTSDEERVLNDGARIEMGEVLFTFRNR